MWHKPSAMFLRYDRCGARAALHASHVLQMLECQKRWWCLAGSGARLRRQQSLLRSRRPLRKLRRTWHLPPAQPSPRARPQPGGTQRSSGHRPPTPARTPLVSLLLQAVQQLPWPHKTCLHHAVWLYHCCAGRHAWRWHAGGNGLCMLASMQGAGRGQALATCSGRRALCSRTGRLR